MNIQNSWAWASHQPMIRMVCELYNPGYVLEIGVGIFSTSLFKDMDYLGAETSKEWADYISTKFNVPVLNYSIDTELAEYYDSLPIGQGQKLLFVDGEEGTRLTAINTLSPKFNIIIFHDCEPEPGARVNQYAKVNTEGFKTYFLKTNMNWTGLMVRKDYGFEVFEKTIQKYIEDFKKQSPDIVMEFCDKYE